LFDVIDETGVLCKRSAFLMEEKKEAQQNLKRTTLRQKLNTGISS